MTVPELLVKPLLRARELRLPGTTGRGAPTCHAVCALGEAETGPVGSEPHVCFHYTTPPPEKGR